MNAYPPGLVSAPLRIYFISSWFPSITLFIPHIVTPLGFQNITLTPLIAVLPGGHGLDKYDIVTSAFITHDMA